VYKTAAWKDTVWRSVRFSSITTCMPKPASGFTLGRASRSVVRTKKLPWNVWINNPLEDKNKNVLYIRHSPHGITRFTGIYYLVHRILMTASNPIFRFKYLCKAHSKLSLRSTLLDWYKGKWYIQPPENLDMPPGTKTIDVSYFKHKVLSELISWYDRTSFLTEES